MNSHLTIRLSLIEEKIQNQPHIYEYMWTLQNTKIIFKTPQQKYQPDNGSNYFFLGSLMAGFSSWFILNPSGLILQLGTHMGPGLSDNWR